VQFAAGKTLANVQLASTIDKKKVPCRDFVLRFRDAAMEKACPVAMSVNGPSGQQAIAFNVLPTKNATKKKYAKKSQIAKTFAKIGVDFDPSISYDDAQTQVEEEESKGGDVEMQEEMLSAPKLNEYIFIIDRSGSMHETIKLARQAL